MSTEGARHGATIGRRASRFPRPRFTLCKTPLALLSLPVLSEWKTEHRNARTLNSGELSPEAMACRRPCPVPATAAALPL